MSVKKVAQIIVEALENAGVKHCYGIVGDTLNHITDAMSRSSIEWVGVRHEEVGGFAAGAESFVSGNLTACAGSCGPGGLHFINGLYEAQQNRAPVVLIASQLATSSLGTSFPQEVDFKSIYRSWTVFCEQIQHPDQAQLMITMAIQAALNRRGVAVLIVPVDMSIAEVTDNSNLRAYHPKPVSYPDAETLSTIADLLNKGKKVAIFAGIGASDAHDEVVMLAERLKAPVAHTSRAKDFIEYDNPYSVGMTGVLGVESAYETLLACDTLLILGADFAWSQFYPSHATIIQIDSDGTHLGRRHPITIGAVGDIKATLIQLMPLIQTSKESSFLEHSLSLYNKTQKALLHAERATEGAPIHPQYLTRLLSDYGTEDAIFLGDGGTPLAWITRHIRSNGKRRTLLSLRHGTMASAMPQAIGLQKAYPSRQIISLSGDGGLSMLLGDLLTIVQEKLPIKIAIVNNSSLDFVELEQKVEGLLDHNTALKNPDFAKLGEAIGFFGLRVDKVEELDAAVQMFLAYDGPAILDVVTNPQELVIPPSVSIENVTGMALYSAKAILKGRGDQVKDMIMDNFIR